MKRLAYPPDRAWNLLHQAMRASEVMPRKGKFWAPGGGPMLEQWERDNLHFDYRRYQSDEGSGAPVGSLRIGGQSFHPHAITIPPEEFEHWLALQAPAHGASRPTEPLPPQRMAAEGAPHGKGDLPGAVENATEAVRAVSLARTDHRAEDPLLFNQLAAWFAEWAADHPQHSEHETQEAAKAKFSGANITRQMIRNLRKPPDGSPLRPGKKPGKSQAEHARRMRE